MPILSSEPNIYPSDLFDRNAGEDESRSERDPDRATWWAFYTRARQEKSLARELYKLEMHFYLPLVRRRLLVRGKPVHSHVPLFTGYMFMFGSAADRLRALKTNRISQIIAVEDGKQLCHDLRDVQRLIESGSPLTVESRLQPHQRVRIRAGALQGLEGTVVRRKNATRIMVWVKMLQQGVSMDIEDYLLDPID